MFDYICFDIETGGLSETKNPITEIALVVYDCEKFQEKSRFETFVKPYDNLVLEPDALKHTGITLEMLEEDGVDIEDLVDYLVEVFKTFSYGNARFKYKPVLVGHNISKFDVPFIEYAFKRQKLNLYDYVEHYHEDTLFLGRSKWVGKQKKFNLGACCAAAGIELIDAHRAMNDVEANKKLHVHILNTLRQSGNFVSPQQKEERVRNKFNF